MARVVVTRPPKGVVIEYDFAAMNGAELLYGVMADFLNRLDRLPFDRVIEAKYFSGNSYQDGLTAYFQSVRTKKTAERAAIDLDMAFRAALGEAVPTTLTPGFRNFVRALTSKGVRVIISTRADARLVRPAFESLLSDDVLLYTEISTCYGAQKWDAWRRACVLHALPAFSTLAVTGSGHGVKAALLAGMPSMAVVNEHVAYQDFGGADDVVRELSGTTARKALGLIKA